MWYRCCQVVNCFNTPQPALEPPEPTKSNTRCGDCGEYIYYGETYYALSGDIYCETCWDNFIDDCRRCADE